MEKFWLFGDNPPPSADCFVVLSYGVKDSQVPNKPTKALIELAYKWWKKYPRAKVIFSTGDNQSLGVSNARVMANYAEKLGIPSKNIVEEDKSINTYENLACSSEIIKKLRLEEVTIIALDLHMRRAVATARKIGWKNFYWLSAFSKGEPGYGCKRFQTYSRLTILCYEMAAMVYSKVVGWI